MTESSYVFDNPYNRRLYAKARRRQKIKIKKLKKRKYLEQYVSNHQQSVQAYVNHSHSSHGSNHNHKHKYGHGSSTNKPTKVECKWYHSRQRRHKRRLNRTFNIQCLASAEDREVLNNSDEFHSDSYSSLSSSSLSSSADEKELFVVANAGVNADASSAPTKVHTVGNCFKLIENQFRSLSLRHSQQQQQTQAQAQAQIQHKHRQRQRQRQSSHTHDTNECKYVDMVKKCENWPEADGKTNANAKTFDTLSFPSKFVEHIASLYCAGDQRVHIESLLKSARVCNLNEQTMNEIMQVKEIKEIKEIKEGKEKEREEKMSAHAHHKQRNGNGHHVIQLVVIGSYLEEMVDVFNEFAAEVLNDELPMDVMYNVTNFVGNPILWLRIDPGLNLFQWSATANLRPLQSPKAQWSSDAADCWESLNPRKRLKTKKKWNKRKRQRKRQTWRKMDVDYSSCDSPISMPCGSSPAPHLNAVDEAEAEAEAEDEEEKEDNKREDGDGDGDGDGDADEDNGGETAAVAADAVDVADAAQAVHVANDEWFFSGYLGMREHMIDQLNIDVNTFIVNDECEYESYSDEKDYDWFDSEVANNASEMRSGHHKNNNNALLLDLDWCFVAFLSLGLVPKIENGLFRWYFNQKLMSAIPANCAFNALYSAEHNQNKN